MKLERKVFVHIAYQRAIYMLQHNQTWTGNPHPKKMGDNFIGPWGTLNFHLPLGRLSKMWGLKSFTLLRGGTTRLSLLGGMGVSTSPTGQKFTHPFFTRKSAPPTNFYLPHQTFNLH